MRDDFLILSVEARLQSRLGFVGVVSSYGLNDGGRYRLQGVLG